MATKSNAWWPDVSDAQNAEKASRQGFGAAVFVASVTVIVASLALYLHKPILGVDAFGYVDACLFAGIAFGIYRMSRIAAVLGFVLYIAERFYSIAHANNASSSSNVMTVILAIGFLHGMRGTFAYHKLNKKKIESTVTTPAPLG